MFPGHFTPFLGGIISAFFRQKWAKFVGLSCWFMNPKSPSGFLLALGLVIITGTISFGQTSSPNRPRPVSISAKSKERVSLLQKPNGVAQDTTDRDSVVNFIVRLRTSPGARDAASRSNKADQIKREHEEFLSKLNELGSNARTSNQTKTIQVVREFKKSFNGFTIKANRSYSNSITRMPNVISVTEDKKVKANDAASNEVLNVPKVWNEVGATGSGIVIGIIDTGIDYNHPDLGGGIGGSHKVIGGYDFINNDNDPFDDHGHGTHVAGIAAANGTIKGVAPDARLMAIKVLDSYGSGWDSQILAGIEYAIDPDGNPATDDAPDVVNMSLGRAPDPFEPMSEAVNNAVLEGICFVIAAGNSYDYMSVGTPGTAELAITVGAIDNYGYTAYFSSRGPAPLTYILKPDVAAPGVQINSTFPGGQYEKLDGTSMASPHITGVAALILDQHPDWTPAEVKAAMMNNASMDGFEKILETGAGIVDAYKAITTDLIMSPGSISYGRPASDNETYSRADHITITNDGQSSKEIILELSGIDSEPAIDIQLSQSQFTLAAGETKQVTVSINVDMATLGTRNVPAGFYGAIEMTSGSKKLKTLLSIFNPAVTLIKFPNRLPTSMIIGGINSNYWNPVNPTSHDFDVMLPTGTYDILAYFGDSLVVVEDYESTTESKTVIVDSNSAKNKIEFKPVDANGVAFPPDALGTTVMLGPTTLTMWWGPLSTFYFSDSKKHKMFTRLLTIPPDPTKAYEIALSTGSEISSSKIITNDPADYVSMTITNPSLPEGQMQDFYFHVNGGALTTWNTYPAHLPNPANIQVFEDEYDNTFSYYRFLPSEGVGGFTWETGMRGFNSEGIDEFVGSWGTPLITIGNEPFDFNMGGSLVNFTPFMDNWQGTSGLYEGPRRGMFNHAFGERVSGLVPWSLKKDEQEVATGTLMNAVQDDFFYLYFQKEIDAGDYTMTFKWDSYYVGGRFSDVTTDLHFNTSYNPSYDFNPPTIDQFTLMSDGRHTNKLAEGVGGTIHAKISEWYLSDVRIEMRALDSDTWISLDVSESDDMRTGDIPSDLPAGYYSLRLKAVDQSNNSITHTLEPAFTVGVQPVTVPFTKVSLISPRNYDINSGVHPVFDWSDVSNGQYRFQLSKSNTFEELLANESVAASTLSLPNALDEGEMYYWRVKGIVSGHELPWSKIYAFRANTLQPATLVSPAMNAVDVSISPTNFTWVPAEGFDWQTIEIATDDTFSGLVYYYWVPGQQSTYSLSGLQAGKQYYWRVTTFYSTFYDSYQVPSEVFTFKTPGVETPGEVTTGIEDEHLFTIGSYPNPVQDELTVTIPGDIVNKVSSFEILTATGQVVEKQQAVSTKNIFSFAGRTPGMYVVKLSIDGKVHTTKVMKIP